MKVITSILLALILTSCNFSGTTDQSTMKRIKIKPVANEITGEWFLDHFSYKFLKENGSLFKEETKLIIKKNGSFEMLNFPKIKELSLSIDSVEHKGNWSIQKSINKKYWELKLVFLINENKTRTLVLELFEKKGDGLIFWRFIGDPDSGNRLLFKKS